MTSIRRSGTAALAAAVCLAVPGAASATGSDHDTTPTNKPHGHHVQRDAARHAVPPRIAAKLRAAERAAQRAKRQAAAGHRVAAIQALAAVRRHLKAATKPVGARRGDGAATAAAYAGTYGRIADICIGLFAGVPDDVVAANAVTLKAVLDARDVLVAGIATLPDRASYGAALAKIAEDANSEATAIGALLGSGALSDAAKAALTAAQAQVTATAAAAQVAGGATARA